MFDAEKYADFVAEWWDIHDLDYFDDTDWVSSSMLKVLKDAGPLTYHAQFLAKTMPPKESGRELIVGSATHLALFQPELWKDRIAVTPGSCAPKSNKDVIALAQFTADNPGKAIISSEEELLIRAMIESLWANPGVKALLEQDGESERVIRWKDQQSAVPCKAKLDWFSPTRIIDLKTTKSLRGFGSDAHYYSYPLQAAHYSAGVMRFNETVGITEEPEFLFVVVSKQPPHETAILKIEGIELASARREHKRLLQQLRGCHEYNDFFPEGYGEIRHLRIPGYLLRDE